MAIEVITKTIGEPTPPLEEGQMRYIVASNGMYLERKSALFTTSCRVDRFPVGLESHNERCVLHCERIPPALSRTMFAFFLHAFERHGGEAVLLLLYNPEKRQFAWHCPEQTVDLIESWTGRWYPSPNIQYTDPLELPPGFILFGDSHSHAELPAYTSYVDMKDEHFKDGLHIIIGQVDRSRPDIHVDFVMDQRRFGIEPRLIFSEPDLIASPQVPKAWKSKIRIKRIPYRSFFHGEARK